MTTVKESLKIVCLALLAVILGLLAWHLRGWCDQVDQTLAALPATAQSVKEAADTANLVSTQSLDLVGSATKLVEGIGETNNRAMLVLDKLAITSAAATATLDSATRRIDSLETTQAKADAAIDQIATIPPTLNRALEPLPDLQLSLTRTSDATATFISAASALAGNSATAVQHFDARWLAPYSGKHPRLHKVWTVTQGLVGLGARGAQGAYYLDQLH